MSAKNGTAADPPNLLRFWQVLKSWRTRRMLDVELLDQITADLEARRAACVATLSGHHVTCSRLTSHLRFYYICSHHSQPTDATAGAFANFSRNDILRRIEDDRERVGLACLLTLCHVLDPLRVAPLIICHVLQHKRLRERIWVLPVPTSLTATPLLLASQQQPPSVPPSRPTSAKPSPYSPASPSEMHPPPIPPHKQASRFRKASASAPSPVAPPPRVEVGGGPEVALELEFVQLWEGMEDEMIRAGGGKRRRDGVEEEKWELGEEDRLAMRRARERCFVR